jgi:SAM-dependent methyltransferase
MATAAPLHERRGDGRDAQPGAHQRNHATSTQIRLSRGHLKPVSKFHHVDGRYRVGKNAASGSGAATIAEPARHPTGRHRAAARTPRPARPMFALPPTFPAATLFENAQVVLGSVMQKSMWSSIRRILLLMDGLAPSLRRVAPKPLLDGIRGRIGLLKFSQLPDRKYMEETILPSFALSKPQRVLFVGTQDYTQHYQRWFDTRATVYVTIDIRPEFSRYGSKHTHVIGDVRDLGKHFPDSYFDIVMMNGVLGWGLDDPTSGLDAIKSCSYVLRQGGILLLGWNTDRFSDPLHMEAVRSLFEHSDCLGMRKRVIFGTSLHVYDLLVKRAVGAP